MRYARAHLRPWFPCLANRDGYNKRQRRSGEMIARVMGCLARESDKTEPPRPGARSLRQIIEGPLSLERRKARTKAGVAVRVPTRLLALTAAFWHTRPARSLTAYDHQNLGTNHLAPRQR